MKYPKVLEKDEMHKYSRDMKIPDETSFYIDSTYKYFLKSCDTTLRKIKNHCQPMQALYYPKASQYHNVWFINCYAYPTRTGVIWNKKSEFEKYPPTGNLKADSLFTIEQLANHIIPVFDGYHFPEITNDCILVFYCRTMHRDSKELLREVRKNAEISREKIQIIYINSDNSVVPQILKQ